MSGKTRAGRKEEIAKAIVEEFGARTVDEAQEALRQILGPAIEAMLRAELDAHLGYASNDKSPKRTDNRRNGYAPKKVRTSVGEVEISVPFGTATARSSRSRSRRAARTSRASSRG